MIIEHEGYVLCEVNGEIASISKDETCIDQCAVVESKGTNLVPKGTRGIVIALRKPLTYPVLDKFVWVSFESINRTAHMRFEDLIVHGR